MVKSEFSNIGLSLRDLGKIGRAIVGGGDSKPAPDRTPAALHPEAKILFDYKREALELAKQSALDETARTGIERKPTMTDYFIASQKVGERHAEEMADRGIQWTPAVISDLSGQTIDGFQINKSDMEPRREAILLASQRAQQTAKDSGTAVTLLGTLEELQKIQQSNEALPSIESLEDTMDLDGNATLAFYEAVDHHADFKGTLFSNVNFHPAGTLMRDGENGVALTEGSSFHNVTFDGMTADDTLTLAKGNYENIHLTNIRGGSIEIADGTQVDGMNIRGAHAALNIGHASVTNLDATDARIVRLTASAGAEINQSNFTGTTIDMASELEGSTWRNVAFTNANLVDVEMRGASLSNVRFNDTSLAGLDLSGAKLDNIRVNGEVMTDRTQLAALGVTVDNATSISYAPEHTHALTASNTSLADIRATMQGAIATIGSTIPGAEPAIAAAPARDTGKSEIVYTGEANLNQVALTTEVAGQKRTVAIEEQASAANMRRDQA